MNTLIESLESRADRLRLLSLSMTTRAGSGHPTSSLSAAEILSVLFFHVMRFDPRHPEALDRDEFVLSKGHAAPVLYAAMAEAGILSREELDTLREFGSRLEGHPVPTVPGVRAATGSLGQGLSIGAGLALALKMERSDRRVYVLLGDGEMAEGNVWEALNLAPHLGLDNLTAIIDLNRLGQSGPTLYEWDVGAYTRRIAAFDWEVLTADGHSVKSLIEAFENASRAGRPSLIVAHTVKGKGVPFLENRLGQHGKAVEKDRLSEAEAGLRSRLREDGQAPANFIRSMLPRASAPPRFRVPAPYEKGAQVATRTAFGRALVELGRQDPDLVVLDGDVKDSTRTGFFFEEFPERGIEGYIAEQNLAGLAVGLAAHGKHPVLATFAAFLTRAFDQIRMAAYSRVRLFLCGSHAGVSIGSDGPSQMGLEDLAMMRSVYGSIVLVPADAVAAARLTAVAAAHDGIAYLRTARPETEIIYDADEEFEVGGSKVLKRSARDKATIVACGVTVIEALKAAEQLERKGMAVRVLDCYSVKPIDRRALLEAAGETGMLVTVEDHYPEGGLGEAVAAETAGQAVVHRLAVTRRPHSGPPEELLAEQGLDHRSIAAEVRSLLAGTPAE